MKKVGTYLNRDVFLFDPAESFLFAGSSILFWAENIYLQKENFLSDISSIPWEKIVSWTLVIDNKESLDFYSELILEHLAQFPALHHIMLYSIEWQKVDPDSRKDILERFFYASWPSDENKVVWNKYHVLLRMSLPQQEAVIKEIELFLKK